MRPFGRQVFAPKLRKCRARAGKIPPEVLSNIFLSGGLFRRRRAIHEPRDRIGIWLVGRNTGLMEMAAGIVERTFSESPR
jgi:hypothetical protein